MDWTTTTIYPASVYGRHHLRNLKTEAQARGLKIHYNVLDRGHQLVESPSALKRRSRITIRSVAGVVGVIASIKGGIACKDFGIPPLVSLPPVLGGLAFSLHNGIALAGIGIDHSVELDNCIQRCASNIQNAKTELPLIYYQYGVPRGAIAVAEIIQRATWEDVLFAAELGDLALGALAGEETSILRKTSRVISKIAGRAKTDHPHTAIIDGFAAKLNEALLLRNRVKHVGREM